MPSSISNSSADHPCQTAEKAARNDIQCRLSRDTHARLTAFLARCKQRALVNPDKYIPAMTGYKPGLSDAVDQLMFWLDQEQARKAAWNDSKRARRRKADQSATDNAKAFLEGAGATHAG